MSQLARTAPDAQTRRLAAQAATRFRGVLHDLEHDRLADARQSLRRFAGTSGRFVDHLASACRGQHDARASVAEATYAEQEGHHGVNTFTNYHNASGVGTPIGAGAWVQVSCKVYDPYIASVNPDGYWYRIASSPWNDAYYSPANTFMNGDPWNGPYTHNTDFNVPDCGAAPPPPPAPTVTLAQGPSAPAGYRYAVTVDNFAANSSVSVTCFDSVSPSGFYTFSLSTDANGDGFTQSYCYSGDGPDHWVVVNGSVASNHVTWSAISTGGGGTTGGGTTGGGTTGGGTTGSGTTGGGTTGGGTTGGGGTDTCEQYSGELISPIAGNISGELFAHYLGAFGTPVVIDWSYFKNNASFVAEAKRLAIGQFVTGWAPPANTDMRYALGHFEIERDTVDCYLVYDHYDFKPTGNPLTWFYIPEWADKLANAREFVIHASGKL